MKKKFAKIGALFMSFVLVIVATVGITLAYLTKTTGPVTNTFVARSGLLANESSFTLTETKAVIEPVSQNSYIQFLDPANENQPQVVYENTYDNLVPNMTLFKDPVVNMGELIATAYLYVKVTNNLPAGLTAQVAAGWTKISTAENKAALGLAEKEELYAYNNGNALAVGATVTNAYLLEGNTVTVGNFDPTAIEAGDNITLVFQAYLCQSVGFDDAIDAYTECF